MIDILRNSALSLSKQRSDEVLLLPPAPSLAECYDDRLSPDSEKNMIVRLAFRNVSARIGIFGFGVLLAACGTSASNSGGATLHPGGSSPKSPSSLSGVPTTTTTRQIATSTTVTVKPLPDICPLVKQTEVIALLGATPESPGHQNRYEPTYDTCSFSGHPAGSGNSNSISIGVVRKKTPQALGFAKPQGATSNKPIAEIGDSATLYSKPGTDSTYTLQVQQGSLSMSLDASFQATSPNPAMVEADLITMAHTILSELAS